MSSIRRRAVASPAPVIRNVLFEYSLFDIPPVPTRRSSLQTRRAWRSFDTTPSQSHDSPCRLHGRASRAAQHSTPRAPWPYTCDRFPCAKIGRDRSSASAPAGIRGSGPCIPHQSNATPHREACSSDCSHTRSALTAFSSGACMYACSPADSIPKNEATPQTPGSGGEAPAVSSSLAPSISAH